MVQGDAEGSFFVVECESLRMNSGIFRGSWVEVVGVSLEGEEAVFGDDDVGAKSDEPCIFGF